MFHLVSITYPDFIKPVLLKEAARAVNLPEYAVKRISQTREFKIALRKSLFLGLSDGALIGYFRRCNPEISNEQVLANYQISDEKAKDMKDELKKDLTIIMGKEPPDEEIRFKYIFLFDDFSGSGRSVLRKEGIGFKGKLKKVCDSINSVELSNLVELAKIKIYIIFYVATAKALNQVQQLKEDLFKQKDYQKIKIMCELYAIQEIPDEVRIAEDKFIRLLEKYYDPSIEDRHTGSVKFGYDECALPLVLSHNTPNNSVYLLWAESEKIQPLFPRISRHREER